MGLGVGAGIAAGGPVGKIGSEIVDELGDVIEAIINGLAGHTPINTTITKVKVKKNGSRKITHTKVSLNGLEILLLYVLWRRREGLGLKLPSLPALGAAVGEVGHAVSPEVVAPVAAGLAFPPWTGLQEEAVGAGLTVGNIINYLAFGDPLLQKAEKQPMETLEEYKARMQRGGV